MFFKLLKKEMYVDLATKNICVFLKLNDRKARLCLHKNSEQTISLFRILYKNTASNKNLLIFSSRLTAAYSALRINQPD